MKPGDEDVVDAISFMEWLTPKEVAKKADKKLPQTRRVIKSLYKDGFLEYHKDKVRYVNAKED